MASLSPTPTPSTVDPVDDLQSMIESLSIAEEGKDKLRVITEQGDYRYVLQYTLFVNDEDKIWANFGIEAENSPMEVWLRFRGDCIVSQSLRISFNKAMSDARCARDIAVSLSIAVSWWSTEGAHIYAADNSRNNRKARPTGTKDRASNANSVAGRKGRRKRGTFRDETPPPPHSGMKPAQDVVHRILWDSSLPAEQFFIGYIDRFVGIVEKPFTTFNWAAFNEVEPEATAIPRHRIVYFKYKTEKVWDRESRVDHVFGSVGEPSRTIEEIMREEDAKDGTDASSTVEEVTHVYEMPETSHEQPALAINSSAVSTISDVILLDRRPSHFLCLRITSSTVIKKLYEMQEEIRQHHTRFIDRYQPEINFHVTLALFCADDEEQRGLLVDAVQRTIRRVRREMAELVAAVSLNVNGVRLLRQYRVIIADLSPSPALANLLSHLSGYLQEDGVTAYIYPPAGVHLTLCKVKTVRDISQWTELQSWCALQTLQCTDSNVRLSLQKVGPTHAGVELLTEDGDGGQADAPLVQSRMTRLSSKKEKPTRFICLRVTSTKLTIELEGIQELFNSSFDSINVRHQTSTNFHVSLALLCAEEGGEVKETTVRRAIDRHRTKIAKIVSQISIIVASVELLSDHLVIVAKLECSPNIVALQQLIGEAMKAEGLETTVSRELHIKLCKIKCGKTDSDIIRHWCTSKEMHIVDTEPQLQLSHKLDGRGSKSINLLAQGAADEDQFGEGNQLFGVHVKRAHDYESWHSVVYRAASVGAKAFAFFPVEKTSCDIVRKPTGKQVAKFREACSKSNIALTSIVPHGPYAIVLGCEPKKADEQKSVMKESVACIVSHVRWCEEMGIRMYNIHPYTHGVSIKGGFSIRSKYLTMVAENLNHILDATKDTQVTILLENGSGHKGEPCGDFEELAAIIDKVEDKTRVGVCFDTCHAFSAGYDLRTAELCKTVFDQFDEAVGLQYLKAFHLNDSKCELGSGIDRHCNIGKGYIGEQCFAFILNDARFACTPMILETPDVEMNQQLEDMILLDKLARGGEQTVQENEGDDDEVVCMAEEPEAQTEAAVSEPVNTTGIDELLAATMDMEELNAQLMSTYEKVRERRASISLKELLRQKLEVFLNQHMPRQGIRFVMIGGSAMNLGSTGSDTDLALLMDNGSQKYGGDWHFKLQMLEKVARLIKKDDQLKVSHRISNVEVRSGFIPILRLDIATYSGGTHVDINCNDMSGIRDAHLIRAYVSIDDRVSPLCVLFKRWASKRGINEAAHGYPNNYSYILMALHYLQTRAVIPNLQAQHPLYFHDETTVDQLVSRDYPSVIYNNHTRLNNETVAQLFKGMLNYYASEVNYSSQFVSIRSGALLDRSHLNVVHNSDIANKKIDDKWLMYIEDPFERRNTSRCVINQEKLNEVKSIMMKCAADPNLLLC